MFEVLAVPGEPVPPEMQTLAVILRQGADDMSRIISDFLDLHVLVDGQLVLERDEWDLNALIERTVAANRESANSKGIELVLDLDELPLVLMDGDRVGQVLSNMVGNAIKFSPRDTQVSVTSRSETGRVRTAVVDQGPGLTQQDLGRVFQQYARLSAAPTGGEKSTGLGLAICRKLVELHGGQVGVSNNQAEGATFWFSLPVRETV